MTRKSISVPHLDRGVVVGVLAGVVANCVAFYLLPSTIATFRRHKARHAVTNVNIFLGWSGVGWVAALVWSLTPDVEFRFRSPERDLQTDYARLVLVEQTVLFAIADAERELNGLFTRAEAARQSAALLPVEGGNLDRQDSRDLGPADLDEHFFVADRRIAQLKEHLVGLHTIEDAVNAEMDLLAVLPDTRLAPFGRRQLR
jgi:hypothetical protein